jgi:hypothetical protein
MNEPSFEHRLHRLFQEAPVLPDAPLFAARLAQRLERDWTLRRLLIGFTGAAVGLAAMWQLIGQAGVARTLGAVEASTGAFSRNVDLVSVSVTALRQVFPYSTEVTWMLGGMVALAIGLLATRVVDRL